MAETTTISIPRQLGQVIRAKRTQAGLTQQQLAGLAKVSRTFVVRLEAGTATALYPQKLLDVLKVLRLHMEIADDGPVSAAETAHKQDTHTATTGRDVMDLYPLDLSLFEPRPQTKAAEPDDAASPSDSADTREGASS